MLEYFENALRKLHSEGKRRFPESWISKLEKRRVKLESAYATLYEQDRDPISYASLSAQTAYIFAYAPVRAEYTRQYLHRHRIATGAPLFSNKLAKIVSFGGGPASELVGLIRYIEEAGEVVECIDYTIFDKDGDWNEVAGIVVGGLNTDIHIELRYAEVDVSSKTRMLNIDLSDTDMVIFSYIMSELAMLGRKDQIIENFRDVLRKMKLDAKILFIDNLHPIFIKYFLSCKLVHGLKQKNDDDKPINCDFGKMNGIFQTISDALDWIPRTELRSVSKLIVRTNL